MADKPLVIITGPTAVGKTNLSIKLAKLIGGEIISADSMQVYKYMDIGSAKIKPEEMEGVKHHLIDILDPREDFNVFSFKEKCAQAIEEIYKNGHIPIIVGGTGFYIQAVLNDIDFADDGDLDNESVLNIRKDLEEFARKYGAHALHEKLLDFDPVSYEEIHENNVKRTIRAIEFYMLNNRPISEHNRKEREKSSVYDSCYFVLNCPRDVLYERVEKRVDIMMEEGLLKEVQKLKDLGCKPDMTSMQGLGYKEILRFLNEGGSLDEAVSDIKINTRHFAKRQLTWFRREKDCIWVNKEDFQNEEEILLFLLEKCKSRGIIS
ncbi:MAG: tRNA (adenosine(37)-N6)-dimethylallyltransferase MiaA [Lachnospiraceae bacterium]|nr:tRNA (adenosine(37)-N6)-dimethylallyltransferase MiaA [Lachnospiraceae bacterium]